MVRSAKVNFQQAFGRINSHRRGVQVKAHNEARLGRKKDFPLILRGNDPDFLIRGIFHMVEATQAAAVGQQHVAAQQVFHIGFVLFRLGQAFARHQELAAPQGLGRRAIRHTFQQKQGTALVPAAGQRTNAAGRSVPGL